MGRFRCSGGIMVFLGALFWSLNSPLVKFLTLNALLICGLRSVIAAVALLPTNPAQAAAVEQVDADDTSAPIPGCVSASFWPCPSPLPRWPSECSTRRPSGCFCWDWCKRSPSLCGPFSRCWSSRWGWCALCAPAPMGPARRQPVCPGRGRVLRLLDSQL